MKSKNALQSLAAAGKAAAAESRSVAADKLRAPAVARSAPSSAKTGGAAGQESTAAAPARERVALYLGATESQKLQEMRLAVVGAGLKTSDNSLVLTALRCVDLKDKERFVAQYKAVQSEDGRRKG